MTRLIPNTISAEDSETPHTRRAKLFDIIRSNV